MFLEDDDIFGGSPKKKYFDIVFNANQNLVADHLDNSLQKMATLELILEKMMSEEELEKKIIEFKVEYEDELAKRVEDLYIAGMGDIVSQNE